MAEGTSKLSHRNYDIVPVPRLRRQGSETIQGCSRSARSPIPNAGAIWHEPLAFPSGSSPTQFLHFADRDDRLRLALWVNGSMLLVIRTATAEGRVHRKKS